MINRFSAKKFAILAMLFCHQAQTATPSCHLHAPEDYASFSKQPLVIPAVGDRTSCNELNSQRFSSKGRCHCSPDSIGRSEPAQREFLSPSGKREWLP